MASGVDVTPSGAGVEPVGKLSVSDKLAEAQKLKAIGNEKYKSKLFKQAIGSYHRALLYLRGVCQTTGSKLGGFIGMLMETNNPDISPEMQADVTALQLDCYNNLAACILQQEKPNYEKVVMYCDNVLELSPSNVKAMYRRGVAYYHLHNYDKAHTCLRQARETKGQEKDPAIDKYLSLCQRELQKEEKLMKKKYKGMFDKLSSGDLNT
ncbi:tetratricopeptide repeat protein 9C-like [Liolophura sinensis]|uniref:tetratricopeptide repeat protein 9C-like n=1 Tax=Liolophura sinensis TaxID=3198878 RepID=UPI003158B700